MSLSPLLERSRSKARNYKKQLLLETFLHTHVVHLSKNKKRHSTSSSSPILDLCALCVSATTCMLFAMFRIHCSLLLLLLLLHDLKKNMCCVVVAVVLTSLSDFFFGCWRFFPSHMCFLCTVAGSSKLHSHHANHQ